MLHLVMGVLLLLTGCLLQKLPVDNFDPMGLYSAETRTANRVIVGIILLVLGGFQLWVGLKYGIQNELLQWIFGTVSVAMLVLAVTYVIRRNWRT